MNLREVFGSALKETELTQSEAAKRMGWDPQKLASKIGRKSLKADEFIKLFRLMGIELTMESKEFPKVVKIEESMTPEEVVEIALKETGEAKSAVSRRMGWDLRQFNMRFARNTLKAEEFLKILSIMGFDLTMTVRRIGNDIKIDTTVRSKTTFEISIKEIVELALKETGMTQKEAAQIMGLTPTQINSRLIRNSLKAEELLKLFRLIGIDLTMIIKEDGRTVKISEDKTLREIIDYAIGETVKSQRKAAAAMGWKPQNLNPRLVKNTIIADEFLALLDAIGIELEMTVRSTGKTAKINSTLIDKEPLRRVRGMVKGVMYDTGVASAVCSNFFAGEESEYGEDGYATELYVDKDGRYFFVDFNKDNPELDEIRLAPKRVVNDFIEKYGDNPANENNS